MNYWSLSRPKRKLNSIPDILMLISETILNQEWNGQRGIHLSFEDSLEQSSLKRESERRDQGGSGGRTYISWISSLGLIFKQNSSGQMFLTLAGESILDGKSPVEILKHQVLRYQFPSSYSLSVNMNPRFKIRPFLFILKLLIDSRIENYVTEEELAKIVITEAENESDACYNYIINRIIDYRERGDDSLPDDFFEKYSSRVRNRQPQSQTNQFRYLIDIANTAKNWLEYTQLIIKSPEDKRIRINPEKMEEVLFILSHVPPFIDRPSDHEFFQRKYGVDPYHSKDTRNLDKTKIITSRMIDNQRVKSYFIYLSTQRIISKISTDIIDLISEKTGVNNKSVSDYLLKNFPHGCIGGFMSEYFEMAFSGRENATNFEKATTSIFSDVFGYKTQHLGQTGNLPAPDILLLSDDEGYQAILDTKAYSIYPLNIDHQNKMVDDYILNINRYSPYSQEIGFFNYVAGGFGVNFDNHLNNIVSRTQVNGSGITVSNLISMIEKHSENPYSHKDLREIFGLNRQVLLSDL